ncbi:MAG: YbaB/EbfC family nucleoid-associated protein [bacterium]
MFDKLKEINKLRELKNQLKEEKTEAEKDGVKVIVNGNMEIEEVDLNPDLDLKRQSKAVKNAVNDAMRKAQISAAKKMKGMDFSNLGF